MPNQETEKKKKNSQNDSFEIEQSNPQTAEKLTQTDGVSKDIQVSGRNRIFLSPYLS